MKHVGEAALVLPFPLPNDNVAYNNRGHESFLPRAKVEWTGIFICHRLILVVTPLVRLKQ
jgi:hypothetical protein